MFDPFFGLAAIGGLLATIFLIVEARMNAMKVPSIATCIIALLAVCGIYAWLLMLGVTLFGWGFDDRQLGRFQAATGVLATLIVGVPFLINGRKRRSRAAADR